MCNRKLLEKELSDFELDIKMQYPNAEFVEGVILNVEVKQEEQEYYSKLYQKCSAKDVSERNSQPTENIEAPEG